MEIDTQFLQWVSIALLFVAAAWLFIVAHNRRKELDLLCGAIDAVPLPRQIVGSTGQVLYSNPACVDLFGQGERPLYETIKEWIGEDDDQLAALERLIENASRGVGGTVELEIPGERDLASYCRVGANPLRGPEARVFWFYEDISLRRRMEAMLTEEHSRFVEMLANAPLGFFACARDGRFLYVNETMASWLGHSSRQLLSEPVHLHDLLPAPPDSKQPAYLLSGSQSGDLPVELELKTASGEKITVLVSQELQHGPDGQVERMRGTLRNLSLDKDTAAALEEAGQRFRRLFDTAPVGLASVTNGFAISECNRAFANLTERQAGDLRALSLFEIFDEEQREELKAGLEALAKGEVAEFPSCEVKIAGSRDTTCRLSIAHLQKSAPERGFVVYLLDITEQKTLEAQFAQGQKMQAVGQLAGGIAHDFNNLLTAMIGFCDLLLLRHRPGDQSFGDIMQIRQNANRAANLVRQLLAFSRQQSLQPSVLNVTDILAELSHLLRRLLGESVDLQVVHGRDLGYVRADQGQLEQVVINLAVNARDAMPEGGALEIKTQAAVLDRSLRRAEETVPPGQYVVITFKDTGTGIEPENLNRIFDPFFSTKEVGEGTGLGLSTVYGIVKQTGGFVFVDSALGAGTTFTIYLPCTSQGQVVEPVSAASREARDLTGIGTILLVEDEDAVRSFSARALRNKGYRVLEADSGETALEMLSGQEGNGQDLEDIDLLITDVVMPRLDGPSLVKKVRGNRPELKVIFISGYAEDSFRKRLGEEPDIHFLAKPYTLRDLAGKVKEVMGEGNA